MAARMAASAAPKNRFAPHCCHSNPDNPVIGDRSFGRDPARVAEQVVRFAQAHQGAGMIACVKHFPGHGGATADSHTTLPVLTETLAELEDRDLAPFATAVEAGAPSVMIGHLDVEAIAPGVPSSLAPETYAYLREELGFEGVAITDSLGMGAVAGTPALAVKALQAGADLLQGYTSFIYQGPGWPRRIVRGLED